MRTVLIVGATSAIAEQTARIWAARGARLFLGARDVVHASSIAADLRVRGAAGVEVGAFDALDPLTLPALVAEAWAWSGEFDIVLIAHGSLPKQSECDRDVVVAARELQVNCGSVIALAGLVAARLEAQRRGTLVVIGSVAGDRGRASNAVYGSAKAAVAAYCSALRQRLSPASVEVVLVKPGLVDTPMTAEFAKGPLWAAPATVASAIMVAVERHRTTVYTPWYWRWIMLVVRSIPESVFRRQRF